MVANSFTLDFKRISMQPFKKDILAPFYVKRARLTRLSFNSKI